MKKFGLIFFSVQLCFFKIANCQVDTFKLDKKNYDYCLLNKGKTTSAKLKACDKAFKDHNTTTIKTFLIILNNNGKKIIAGDFLDHKFCGNYYEYYRSGKTKIKGIYDQYGKETGKWIYYRRNGKIKRIRVF